MEQFVPKQNIAEIDNGIPEGSGSGSDTGTGTEQNGVALLDKLPGFIYFDYDNIIWGMAPDGSSLPFGVGHTPTVANNGTLVYQDIDGDVMILGPEAPDGAVLLDRRTLARDVSISPDAAYIAYVRSEYGNRSRVVMQHISSGSEHVVPSTALQSFTPVWNSDSSMLAYVTAGTVENSEAETLSAAGTMRRNIYAFDQVATSVEPIVVSSADDAEPAWSPANPNQLAFTRTVDNRSQIWMITYSDTGVPRERQLTQRGGTHPVWIPPDGRWILYENNGQLWKIDTQSPETSETPLMYNDQVVFGHKPAIVSGNSVQADTKETK